MSVVKFGGSRKTAHCPRGTVSRLEADSRLRLAHSILLPRTHGPATHAHAHGASGGGSEGGSHWEKYTGDKVRGAKSGGRQMFSSFRRLPKGPRLAFRLGYHRPENIALRDGSQCS